MEYNIFRENSPSEGFVAGLEAFCALDDVQRDALAAWFETTSDFSTFTPVLPPIISESTLLPDQFRKTAAPIRTILSNWQHRSLQPQDIERDLLLLGLNSDQAKLVTRFVERLSPLKKQIWVEAWVERAQFTGLQTVDDVNIVWDARGVFGGESFTYWASDDAEATYSECLGLRCLAILELMVSDTNGAKARLAVQMNEATFKRLLRAMERAGKQLESLKARIKPMVLGEQEN